MSAATRLERSRHVLQAEHAELRVEQGVVTITKQVVTRQEPVVTHVELARIRGADLRKPTRGQPGWLHVSAVGGTTSPPSELAAASDPYTVPVTMRTLGTARRFVRMVTEHVRDRGLPTERPGDAPRSSSVLVTPAAARTAPSPPPATTTSVPPPPPPAVEGGRPPLRSSTPPPSVPPPGATAPSVPG
ncbi:hypothetical protein [Egicoccus sp. AB-alg2]|uniref:hypothetical protein n=1 Tax=Egicoccus sp. AB-alg2 TaxID=3242693 RepID=UPI00359D6E4A